MDLLTENKLFIPKIRRARATKYLTLTVPAKSVGLFVIPDARLPICIDDEDETNRIIEEIDEIQSMDSATGKTEVISRNSESKQSTLSELYDEMKQELEDDEMFYRNQSVSKISSEGHAKTLKDNQLGDVSSREIEEVVLKITKNFKGKTNRSDQRKKREARSHGRASKSRKNMSFQNKFTPNSSMKKFTPNSSTNKSKSKRYINMKLLEEKTSEQDTVKSKLENLRAKSLVRKKTVDENNQEALERAKSLQETLMELLKPKSLEPWNLSNFFQLRRGEKSIDNKEGILEERIRLDSEEIKEAKSKGATDYLNDYQNDYLEDMEHSFYEDLENYPDVKIVGRMLNGEDIDAETSSLDNNKEVIRDLVNYLIKPRSDQATEETLNGSRNDSNLGDDEDYIEYGEGDSKGEGGGEGEGIPKLRKKRQDKQFTEEDIIRYRQLMNSNIRHMRENMLKNKLKLKLPKKDQINLSQRINRLKEAVEIAQKSNKDQEMTIEITTKSLLKKPKFSFDGLKIDATKNEKINHLKLTSSKLNDVKLNHAKLNSAKLLKSRLAQHQLHQNASENNDRSKNENKKHILNNKVEMDEETKELIKMIKNELRNRQPRNLKFFEKEYVPKVKLEENIRVGYVPRFRNVNMEIDHKRRVKRYITKEQYSKYDNTVNSLNEIIKDGEYFIPKIGKSDFTLVLPNKDELSLKNTEDTSEIKLKHIMPKKKVQGAATLEVDTKKERLQQNNFRNASLIKYDDKSLMKDKSSTSKINHFNLNGTKDMVRENVDPTYQRPLDKFFDKIFELVLNVREKLKSFFKNLDN